MLRVRQTASQQFKVHKLIQSVCERMATANDDKKSMAETKIVLGVTLLEYKNISTSPWQVFGTPDVYFTVTCPTLRPEKKYKTLVKEDQSSGTVNETFNFVLSKDDDQKELSVVIKAYDDDVGWDDEVGEISVDVSSIAVGSSQESTHTFGKKSGELKIKISKKRTDTDFRLSTDINDNEKNFRRKRIPKVANAIQRVLGKNENLQSADQVPEISVVGSGGGYRAAIGMSGGMQALKDHNLLDVLTYVSGLSGSSWYIASAFSHMGMSSNGQEAFHRKLREAMGKGFYSLFLKDVAFHGLFRETYGDKKQQYEQPTSYVVDMYGYALGERLLDERHMELGISSFRSQVSEGKVPYPILTSMHVKSNTPSHEFYAFVENTPYEISLPLYGINMTPEVFGSHWNQGVLSRKCPEFPLHFYLASCGCAFAILLRFAGSEAGEEDEIIIDYINGLSNSVEKSRELSKRMGLGISSFEKQAASGGYRRSVLTSDHLEKHEPTSDLNDKLRQLEEEYPADSQILLEKRKSIIQKKVLDLLPEGILEDFKKSPFFENGRLVDLNDGEEDCDYDEPLVKKRKRRHSMMTKGAKQHPKMTKRTKQHPKMTKRARQHPKRTKRARQHPMMTRSRQKKMGRNFGFDRSAEILNFAYKYDEIKVMRSPGTEAEVPQNELFQPGSRLDILQKFGFREAEPMDIEADNISVIDAGILKNVGLECVLRPERRSDLIIVFDMNAYDSDSNFDYRPIVQSALHAWRDGLKFPNIDTDKLVNSPPQELLTFESDADDCPTIMWFTLSNKKFKEHKTYVPRSTAKPPRNNRRPFNDFPVYDDGNNYGTFKFQYSAYEFDQLHELMHYNVSLHVEDIKVQIEKAIARKLRRLRKMSEKKDAQ